MGMSRSNFLQSVCDSARTTGAVNLTSTLDSSKDYVAISDVTRLLPAIASRGKSKMYNIASGANTSHKRVLRCMQKKIDFELTVTSNASREVFPVIDIEALIHEFGYEPTPFDIGFDSYLRGFNI
jgi:GDP-D-mannose dehydratase